MTHEVIRLHRQTEKHTDGLYDCVFCFPFGIETIYLVYVQIFISPNRNFRRHIVLLLARDGVITFSTCMWLLSSDGLHEFSCFPLEFHCLRWCSHEKDEVSSGERTN